nr:hypothetical protein [Actinomycetales bacterium]
MRPVPVLVDAVFRPRSATLLREELRFRSEAPVWVRELALVAGAFVFLTVMAQIVVPLPFTPVPLSLSTLAVVVTGAALGPGRA